MEIGDRRSEKKEVGGEILFKKFISIWNNKEKGIGKIYPVYPVDIF